MKQATLAVVCIAAGLLLGNSARSQELAHPLTIADCPPGTVLAVQDTEQPMLSARIPDPNAGYAQNNQDIIAQQQQATIAPRQFVTGCVPRTQLQQR